MAESHHNIKKQRSSMRNLLMNELNKNFASFSVQPPSRILVLRNLIKDDEIQINEEIDEILEDVKEECTKYGEVVSIKLPRPKNGQNIPGLGKIFVEFRTIDQAETGHKKLSGRFFSGDRIECSYYDEKMYSDDNFGETGI